TLTEKPLTSFGTGLLVLLLLGPVSMLLLISVVGVAVLPIVMAAVVAAAFVGRVGVMRWMGVRLLGDDGARGPLAASWPFVVGFVLLTLVYMVPLLGLASWGLVS